MELVNSSTFTTNGSEQVLVNETDFGNPGSVAVATFKLEMAPADEVTIEWRTMVYGDEVTLWSEHIVATDSTILGLQTPPTLMTGVAKLTIEQTVGSPFDAAFIWWTL